MLVKEFSLALLLLCCKVCEATKHEADSARVDSPTAKQLLLKIVPKGGLPTLPDGFPSLDELKTDKFDYTIRKGKVTAKIELEDPVSIIENGMKVHDVIMSFEYNKRGWRQGHWKFNAEGKWRQGNMTARVQIEESKVGKHHTLVAASDWLNVYEVASSISDGNSIEAAGVSMDVLRNLTLKDAEMYSVFKGGDDYVFMVSGTPFLEGTKVKDCKVFVRSLPNKPGIFSVLLEFQQDYPSRVLLKLMSDKLFQIPFINNLIGRTRLFRTSETNFGFVASTGDVDKLPLKSFSDGILSKELESHISKGLTLLLPIQLGGENDKPVRVAVQINPPSVKFLTGKHETVSVAQTLKALSPSTKVDALPLNFPDLSTININHFSYDIDQGSFFVYSRVNQEFWAVPGLLSLAGTDVMFRHRVDDQVDTWTFEGTGYSQLGGNLAKISISTDEETKVVSLSGTAGQMSVTELVRQYNLSFIPDEESRKIVEKSKMNDFFFVNPQIKSTTSEGKLMNRYLHISGKGHFPGVKRLTEAEAIVYENNGRLQTAVGFIFPKIPMNSLIDAITGFQTSNLELLHNSFNTSIVLSPESDHSMFDNPTLSGLSFERGMTLIGLFKVPEDCEGSKVCESAQMFLDEQWYRVQGLITNGGLNLAGMLTKDYMLGTDLLLKDNILEFTIGEQSTFAIHSKLKLPQENLSFAGTVNFNNETVLLEMESDDKIVRKFTGGVIGVDNLAFSTPISKLAPLKELKLTGHMTLGEYGNPTARVADAQVAYNPSSPALSRILAKFDNITFEDLVDALETSKIVVPRILKIAEFTEGFTAVYDPTVQGNTTFFIKGALHVFDKYFNAYITMKDPQHLVVDTEHAPSPFVLSGGSVVIQRDEATSRGGPRLHVEVSPNNTEVRLLGFAKALGISSSVGVDVTDQGTGFPIYGRLFDVNDVGLLISSREFLSDMEGTEYSAYGCLQSINQNVTAAVENLVKAAAEEADSFILQANDNLREAKGYYRKASKNEQFFREKLDSESAILEEREREVWSAEERYNNSCQLGHCKKACIGCPDWNRCCTRDVFGNCVECPSWNKCCYTTGDPVCVAKNHGCQHIRKVAEGNLEDAKDILLEQKKHVQLLSRKVFDAEFSKGKTKAVLDAAGKALSLIDRDASTGISASRAIKRHGINGLLNLTSICFTTPVERLATSCIPMNISASLLGSNDVKSLPFSACLNKQLVPNIARFLANTMFPEISRARTRRSLLSEERERYYDDGENIEKTTEHTRKRRDVKVSDEVVERSKERIEPFWDLIHQHNPLDEAAKPIPNHPAMGKATLKRKWKIPVSRRGRCKIYHQLLNICRDMMKTVKRMYGTYMYERYLFAKEKDNFRRRLRRVTKQLEQSAELVSGTKDQIVEIEKSLNFLSNGVRKWMDKSNKEIKRQEMISVKAWVKGMDSRIQSLGGEGVKRFLGNLFKAFDGLFESSNVPSKQAGKALSVMQRVKQIHSAFGEIFKKNITLARANYYADRVLYDVTEIKDIGVYCRK